MNMRPDIKLIEAVSEYLTDTLGDDFDPETFWDTLDGETDVLDIADKVISNMQADVALVSAIAAQTDALAKRGKRIAARADAAKGSLLLILNAAGQKKMERPAATISRRSGSLSVHITDEAAVPSQLCTVKTITAPDKAAIRAQLEAGETVPGAELVRGADGVIVRAS